MPPLPRSAVLLFLTAAPLLAAAPVRIDFNADTDRRDVLTHAAQNWRVKAGPEASFTAGDLSLRLSSEGTVDSAWWKKGFDTRATMASDAALAAPGRPLVLELQGLTPGLHTLTSLHSSLDTKAVPLVVTLSGEGLTQQERTLTSTARVLDDRDAAFAHFSFTVPEGTRSVRLSITPRNASDRAMLNGLVLDGTDPERTVSRGLPADGDEHVDGEITLTWKPAPAGAFAQQLYLGTSLEAVGTAKPGSPEFVGNLSSPHYQAGKLDPFLTYYWRVDTVGMNRVVTPGPVWSFRPAQLAFPGAEGHGRFAIGGRGGRVIEVTNLEDSGPGSLRAAIEEEGPRTVVFRVGGAIKLKSKLIVTKPYITIAGQTAPGDGIAVHNYTFGAYGTHDVIIRHVRVRVGDASGETLDGAGLGGCDHAIMDHCSIAWSIDEGFSSRGARNITLQRSIITEPLNLSHHRKYLGTGKGHAYAGSVSGDIGSLHHNLLAHCAGRNWSLAGGLTGGGAFAGRLDIRNNVVYNWKDRTNDGGVKALNLVGNFYIPGPATKVSHILKPDLGSREDPQTYFVTGNAMEGHPAYERDNWGSGAVRIDQRELDKVGVTEAQALALVRLAEPFCDSHVTTHSAAEAYTTVMADVGANKPRHDSVDLRIIADVAKRSFTARGSKGGLPGIIDSQKDVGGYPLMKGGPAPVDSDHDGMPDTWETTHGLNPADASDGPKPDAKSPGYTNLETYLNGI